MTRPAALAVAAAGRGASRWWPRLRRWALPVFALVVLGLLATHAREIDWAGAWRALRGYDARTLALAALLAAGSHALYGCFDLLGRGYTRHHLPAGRVWATAFVSYAFNLNLGSIIGGFGLRLRLYSRLGLRPGVIGRVIGLSLVTNWLGHAAVGGLVLVAGAIPVPASWPLHGSGLRLFGAALLAGVAAYLALCVFARRRQWSVHGHRVELPPPRIAFAQLGLSMLNWSLMGATIFMLLGAKVPYPTVLGVLLLAGIAGVATHIPAGLGVLEAVFVTLLAGRLPQATVLGAMLAYRALYYLLPLGVALATYFALEGVAARRRPRAQN